MQISRRAITTLAVTAATALGLMSAVPAFAQKKTPMVISYTATPEFGAVFIAKERGFFDKRGIDATLQLIPVSPNVPAAVMSGSVQVGGTTPSVLLQAADSGIDLVVIAGGGVYDTASKGIGLVAKTGFTVNGPQDFVGKKIGVPGFGAAIHLLTRRWLMNNGVDLKKVTFVEVAIPQMPDVLKGGSVDAVATAEPFVSRIVQSQIGTAVPAFANDLPSGFATVLYVSTRQWATTNGATVKAFREAVAEAVAYGNANKDQAYEDIGKYFKVPPPVLKATPWPNFVTVMEEQPLRFWVNTMQSQDMLKKQPQVLSLILK